MHEAWMVAIHYCSSYSVTIWERRFNTRNILKKSALYLLSSIKKREQQNYKSY